MDNKPLGNILVVDDQQNWRDVLANILIREGHTVHTADSFERAMAEISHVDFDLLVLDLRLDDTNIFNVEGLELTRLVKNRPAPPSVIILTGYRDSIRTGMLELPQADALLLKVPPGSRFDSRKFKDKVQELLLKTKSH